MSLPMTEERRLQSLSEGAIHKVNGAVEQQRQSQSPPATTGGAAGPTNKQLPRDLRQELTDRMAAALEAGTIPWERPWNEVKAGRPRNLLSARDYQGGNRFMLMMVQIEKGYVDPRFGTVRQINQADGTVKKGEKGYPIEYWSNQPFYDRRDVQISYGGERASVLGEDRQGVVIRGGGSLARPRTVAGQDLSVWHEGQRLNWREAHQRLDRLVAKVSTVFNVEQTTGLTLDPVDSKSPSPVPTVDRAERLLEAMRRDGLQFETDNRAAYYVPKRDTVHLPDRDRFDSSEGYYGTALHEVGHATGAAKRLNREGIVGDHPFGSEAYAREELRAELFSVFMAADTGVPHDESQHRAYIQSWAKILKSDKHEIFRAASEAGKAVDYVLQKEQELARAPEHSAERLPESELHQNARAEPERAGAPEPGASESERPGGRRNSHVRRRGLER
jgi:antirestriction protein ArdC